MTAAPGSVPPGDSASGSMRFTYDIPAGPGVRQIVFYPKANLEVAANPAGQDPTGVGLWIKGAGAGPELAESYIDVNGTVTTLYPTTITWQGWQLVVAELPAGLTFPLSVNFLDLLTISNPTELKGSVDLANLEALYSPRPVTVPSYTAVPKNPSWLQLKESSNDFSRSGSTILTGDDAHLLASDPGSASANVIAAIAKRLPTLAPQARPSMVQAMGDMADDGNLPDLQFAKSEIASLGQPYHDAVGNHEISQTALPENGNFAQVFGDTHYAYADGGANVIVTDSAHGGLLASDPGQVPGGAQYPWLVQQLSANRSPVVIVATHEPAYDPHSAANSQFSDRWEAQMYLELVQRYQQSHPSTHVIMLYGHARGFAEQILSPQGQPVSPGQGIPQFTFADLGVPPYASANEGGFYHFGLLHVTPGGDLQFTVEPVLSSISVTAPSPTLAPHASETITATGTNVGGDNNPALTLPIADPASHVWSSGSPEVASVDAVTGVVTAHRPGHVTISVTSGGVTATTLLTVTG
jgi:Calcineurin-like phosphoesterase/Bacterial Ig-like domain (group 2)